MPSQQSGPADSYTPVEIHRGYIRTKLPQEKIDQKTVLSKLSVRQEESTKQKEKKYRRNKTSLWCA